MAKKEYLNVKKKWKLQADSTIKKKKKKWSFLFLYFLFISCPALCNFPFHLFISIFVLLGNNVSYLPI